MEDCTAHTRSWAARVSPQALHKDIDSNNVSIRPPVCPETRALNHKLPSAVGKAKTRGEHTAEHQSSQRRRRKKNLNRSNTSRDNGPSRVNTRAGQQQAKEEQKKPVIFSAPPVNAWKKAEVTKEIVGKMTDHDMKDDNVVESIRNMGIGEDARNVSDADDDLETPTEQSDDALATLSKTLKDIDVQYIIVPRGIDNPGNICFASSVIQALLACPTFCQIFYIMRKAAPSIDSKIYPVLKSMSVLAREFQFEAIKDENVLTTNFWSGSINVGVVTSLIHESFKTRYKGDCRKRQVEQEDAHEFLHCLLDAMHQEIMVLQSNMSAHGDAHQNGVDNPNKDDISYADGWLTKAGKRAVKQQVIRPEITMNNTLITELFEGMQSTSISSRGNPPSVTMHPFLIVEIPLFDPTIDSLSGALDSLTATEVLSGYRPGGQGVSCDANKAERFHKLPPVLIFHLMRFQFTGSTEKLNKMIRFENTLNIKNSWLTSGSKDRHAAYTLVSTISHHGQSIARGHFTAHVLQHGNSWLHFNDEHVHKVRQESVFHDSPYLLVYNRI